MMMLMQYRSSVL